MMPFVMLVSGLLVALVVVVTGVSMVLVWTIAYGSGRYCRHEIQKGHNRAGRHPRVIHLHDQRVS